MLLELDIRDFAIIERTLIRFADGLNALTGETGAGKSILLDALGAVLGARASSDLVRTGASVARVEAAFELAADERNRLQPVLDASGIEIDHDNMLILGRELQSSGRSAARINGRLATAGALREIGELLVDIHGQSDHLAILREAEQRSLLDRFGNLESKRLAVGVLVREQRELRRRISELSRGAREREQRIDLLGFQANEIEAASLVPGEDTALAAERQILRNADRLRADAHAALALLSGSDDTEPTDTATFLRQVTTLTSAIVSLDPSTVEIDERATEVLVLVDDLARDLRVYADSVDSDDQRLVDVEDRLDLIQTLRRKYGSSVEEIILFGRNARAELKAMASGEHNVDELRERLDALEVRLGSATAELSTGRREAAKRLSAAIMESIAELAMGSSVVQIAVTQRDDPDGIALDQGCPDIRTVSVDETGADRIEFRIAANAGEEPRPLSRVASGGRDSPVDARRQVDPLRGRSHAHARL